MVEINCSEPIVVADDLTMNGSAVDTVTLPTGKTTRHVRISAAAASTIKINMTGGTPTAPGTADATGHLVHLQIGLPVDFRCAAAVSAFKLYGTNTAIHYTVYEG